MAIPVMPSTATPYTITDHADPIDDPFPCRVVPKTSAGRGRAAPPYMLYYTHWIDFPASAILHDRTAIDLTFVDGRLGWRASTDLKVVIGGRATFFRVLFVEDRYIDTPNHYRRAYVVRVESADPPP